MLRKTSYHRLPIVILGILISYTLPSCWLSGHVYKPVDGPQKPGTTPQSIQLLHRGTLEVYLWATTRKDTTTFEVHLMTRDFAKEDPFTCADIQLALSTYPKGQAIPLNSLDSARMTYRFISVSKQHHYHKIQVALIAELHNGSYAPTLRQEIIFKRYWYFDIAGN